MDQEQIPLPAIGTYTNVYFLDHVENGPAPAVVRVTGQLVDVKPSFIRVRAWVCFPEHDPASSTEWCIVRSTIKRAVTLVEVRV